MLILKIWEKDELPANWENSIICPIYKKGDRMQCKNYRQITLLNVAPWKLTEKNMMCRIHLYDI